MGRSWARAAVAELVGTFALTFFAVLSISAVPLVGPPGSTASLVTIGFAQGLIIAVMVAALSAVSGGHFNPAITLGFVVTRRMRLDMGALYWGSQIVGAILAALLAAGLVGFAAVGAGTPTVVPPVNPVAAGVLEAVATFFLVLVVFGTAVDQRAPRAVFPLAIGLTLAAGIFIIGPLTGGALNPARALGPALVSGQWSYQAVYWIGPLIGGALAALLEEYLFIERPAEIPQPVVGGPTEEEKRREAA